MLAIQIFLDFLLIRPKSQLLLETFKRAHFRKQLQVVGVKFLEYWLDFWVDSDH